MLRSDSGPVERHQLAIVASGKRANNILSKSPALRTSWAFCCSKFQPYGDENPTSPPLRIEKPTGLPPGFKSPRARRESQNPTSQKPSSPFQKPTGLPGENENPTGLPGRNSKAHGPDFKIPRDRPTGFQNPTGLPEICDLLPRIPFVWGGAVQFIV